MHVSDSNSNELKSNKYYGDINQEKRFANSMVFRVLVLIILLAILSVPVLMIENVINKELTSQQNSATELSDQWGDNQTLIGPILSIPYVERISKIQSQTDSSGVRSSVSKDIFNNKTLIFLPENLRINAQLKDKVLSKNSIQNNVYEGDIELSGNFNLESLPKPSAFNSIEWDKAFLAMGVNNNQSIKSISPLRWEGSSTPFKPSTNITKMLKNGFHANLEEVANDADFPQFKIQLNLKGKKQFKFAPLGELTSASIKSNSSQLSINGDISATSTVVTDDSFEAIWRITNLSRNYPQQWLIEEGIGIGSDSDSNKNKDINADFSSALAGVELLPTVQNESKILLKIKSILPFLIPMLGFIFLSIVILEFKRNIHAKPKFLHYIMVSLTVLSVPLILFTIKDLTNFEQAYQIAAGTSIILIVIYMMSALKSFFKAFYIFLIMASLYGTLYIYLQMPEYVFFAYSAAGLFITILLMMASINIHEDE